MSEDNHRPTPDIVDQAAGALRDAPVPAGPPAELMAATVAAVQHRLAGPAPAELARQQRRRRIMRYVSFGAATAATALIATLAAVLWPAGGRALAFDQVIENVRNAESVTFVEKQTIGNQPATELKFAIRGANARIEVAGGTTILIIDTKVREALVLMPAIKAYERSGPDSKGNRVGDLKGKTPIDVLVAFRDRKPDSTTDEKVDGKPTTKLTFKNAMIGDRSGDWVIWVDRKTELPVKISYEGTVLTGNKEAKLTTTLEGFTWNEKLDDKLFDMRVPDGYTEGMPGRAPPKKK